MVRALRVVTAGMLAALLLSTTFGGAAAFAVEPIIKTSFTETFDSEVAVSDTQAIGAWYIDRYRPAVFESTVFDRGTRLRLGVNAADSAANRPAPYSSAFYNTQGRKFDLGNGAGSYISGDVFIGSDFESSTRRTDMWATTVDGAGAVSGYPIIGFVNGVGFRVYTQDTDQDTSNGYQAGWVSVGLPEAFAYGSWHNVRTELTESAYLFYVDGNLVFTDSVIEGSAEFKDMMLQAYNFGETYNVYWDNVSAGSIVPEPAPDTTAPVTKVAEMTSVAGKAVLRFVATDKESGVAGTYSSVDGGEFVKGDEVSIEQVGDHTVDYYSVDEAGNVEETKSVSLSVWGTVALSISGPAVAPNYGGTALATVRMSTLAGQASAAALSATSVTVERLVGSTWTKLADVSVDEGGMVNVPILNVVGATALRARVDDQAPFSAAMSTSLVIKPRAYLTRPTTNKYRVAKGAPLTITSVLKGRHTAGTTPVRFYLEREELRYGKKVWVRRLSVAAKAADYGTDASKVTATVRLKLSGRWRAIAYHAADSDNVGTITNPRSFAVQ